MKITLVILALNEIEALPKILPRIPTKEVDEVLAIDGGSTDGTKEFFKQHNIRLVEQKSRGRGAAFHMAVEEAQGDILIFFSPDGNETPEDIPKFRTLLEKGYDVVIASRMMKGAHNEEDTEFFKWRKWANNVFNLLANLFFKKEGRYITDSINGFRAIKKEAFKKLNLDSKDYTIEYQMTIRALKKKLKIAEFPTFEGSRLGGKTGAKSIPTGLRFVKMFLKELVKK